MVATLRVKLFNKHAVTSLILRTCLYPEELILQTNDWEVETDAGWVEWDEYDVGKWMKQRDLGKYALVFVENEITGRQLPDCLEEKMLSGDLHHDLALA